MPSSAIFKTPERKARFVAAYDAALSLWPAPYELIYAPTRFGRTHVVASGPPAAPAVVLLHGVLAGATMWYPQVAELSRHFRVYAVDILGDVNKSEPVNLPGTKAQAAEWLASVFGALNIVQAHIVGISFGSFVALNFAIHAPARVRKIVVMAPAACFAPYTARFLAYTISTALSRHPIQSVLRWAVAKGNVVDNPVIDQMAAALKFGQMRAKVIPGVFSDAELRRVAAPTLLMVGDHDVCCDPKATVARARRLIPNVETEIVPRAGHLLSMEQPERVNASILQFLR